MSRQSCYNLFFNFPDTQSSTLVGPTHQLTTSQVHTTNMVPHSPIVGRYSQCKPEAHVTPGSPDAHHTDYDVIGGLFSASQCTMMHVHSSFRYRGNLLDGFFIIGLSLVNQPLVQTRQIGSEGLHEAMPTLPTTLPPITATPAHMVTNTQIPTSVGSHVQPVQNALPPELNKPLKVPSLLDIPFEPQAPAGRPMTDPTPQDHSSGPLGHHGSPLLPPPRPGLLGTAPPNIAR